MAFQWELSQRVRIMMSESNPIEFEEPLIGVEDTITVGESNPIWGSFDKSNPNWGWFSKLMKKMKEFEQSSHKIHDQPSRRTLRFCRRSLGEFSSSMGWLVIQRQCLNGHHNAMTGLRRDVRISGEISPCVLEARRECMIMSHDREIEASSFPRSIF
jgi:hypothetical protein